MTGEPDLISLLYRADWTQLTLSAQVNDGSTLLIAPGRRYRLQAPDYLAGSDGDRPWEVSQDDGAGIQGTVHRIRGPRPPLDQLLCPAQLLKRSRLGVTGHVSVLGRDALRVVVTRRPGTRDGMDASGPIARPPVIRGMAEAEASDRIGGPASTRSTTPPSRRAARRRSPAMGSAGRSTATR